MQDGVIIYFENLSKFKHFGTAVTNRNYIHKDIKRKLISGIYATIQFQIFYRPKLSLKT